jgi:hypothetical protein
VSDFIPAIFALRGLIFALVLASCLFAGDLKSMAWDAAGHEVIDAMAEARLNPKAREAVNAMAQAISTPARNYNAITIGCWMDDLRKKDIALPDHGRFFTWHYIDIGIEPGDPVPSFLPGNDNEFQGNAVQGLKRAMVVLQGGTDPYVRTKAMACAMVMHLVSDIHQPLHAATHYFHTSGGWLHHDAGGNKEYVVNGPPGDSRFNLHNFWDSAWRASFDDATGCVLVDDRFAKDGPQDPQAVQEVAQALALTPPVSGDLRPNFDGWARESNRLARDFAYAKITATADKKYCRLSSAYVAGANALARERLVLAAWRLAELLNETLGAEGPITPPAPFPAGPPGAPPPN